MDFFLYRYAINNIVTSKYKMYRVSVSVLAIMISGTDDTHKQSIDIGIGIGHHGTVPSLENILNLHPLFIFLPN